MKKILGAVIAAVAGLALVLGASLPANAWWYNTMKNTGTLTLSVINTDGARFNVAGGNSASDIQYVSVPQHYRLIVTPAGAGSTYTPCATLKPYTFLLPSYRFNTMYVKRVSC